MAFGNIFLLVALQQCAGEKILRKKLAPSQPEPAFTEFPSRIPYWALTPQAVQKSPLVTLAASSGTGEMLASMMTSSWEAVPLKATTMPRPATCHTPNCCGTSSSCPVLEASLQASPLF